MIKTGAEELSQTMSVFSKCKMCGASQVLSFVDYF